MSHVCVCTSYSLHDLRFLQKWKQFNIVKLLSNQTATQDETLKAQLRIFGELTDITIPGSWQEVEIYKAKYKELAMLFDSLEEKVHRFEMQQPLVDILKDKYFEAEAMIQEYQGKGAIPKLRAPLRRSSQSKREGGGGQEMVDLSEFEGADATDGSAPAPGAAAGPCQRCPALEDRMGSLQTSIESLQGQVSELESNNKKLTSELQAAQTDASNARAAAAAAAASAAAASTGGATASTAASTEGGAKKKQKVSGGGNLTAAKSGGASKSKKADSQGKGKDKDKGKGKDDRQSIKQMNDVTAVAGVNIDDEQLMEFENDQGALDDDPAEAEAMFIEPAAVRRRIMRTAVRYGVSEVSDATTKFVSMMAEERIRSCVTQLIAISKHRTNLARESNLPVEVSSDSRKLLRLIAKLEKEVIERKEKEHRDHLIAMAKKKESTLRREKAGEDGKFSELKQVRQEEIKRQQQNVTNAALLAAVGSKSMFQFKAAKAPAAAAVGTPGTPGAAVTPAPASAAISAVSQPGGEDSHLGSTIVTRFKTREEQRKIALDDCIMFLEKEPQMCKSALLYKCYLRRGQELEPGAVPQDQRLPDKGRRK
eukprot:TRINITY_DN672_c0_g1_i1.p1 TRINITY_DN672_c0_g1~~TRINITY_DN672_c0_g1_i1.p1  ORF type:complete len:595 (+),score=189.22 TRINITY_DN672_c0_g1_i1:922-2706(+)